MDQATDEPDAFAYQHIYLSDSEETEDERSSEDNELHIFAHLPTDVWLMIFECLLPTPFDDHIGGCDCVGTFSSSTEPSQKTHRNYNTLKDLRLVCKLFNAMITETFFKTITITLPPTAKRSQVDQSLHRIKQAEFKSRHRTLKVKLQSIQARNLKFLYEMIVASLAMHVQPSQLEIILDQDSVAMRKASHITKDHYVQFIRQLSKLILKHDITKVRFNNFNMHFLHLHKTSELMQVLSSISCLGLSSRSKYRPTIANLEDLQDLVDCYPHIVHLCVDCGHYLNPPSQPLQCFPALTNLQVVLTNGYDSWGPTFEYLVQACHEQLLVLKIEVLGVSPYGDGVHPFQNSLSKFAWPNLRYLRISNQSGFKGNADGLAVHFPAPLHRLGFIRRADHGYTIVSFKELVWNLDELPREYLEAWLAGERRKKFPGLNKCIRQIW